MSLRSKFFQRFPRQQLGAWSRDRRFLVKAGLAIFIGSVILGFLVSSVSGIRSSLLKPRDWLNELTPSEQASFESFAFQIRNPEYSAEHFSKLLAFIELQVGSDPIDYLRSFSPDGLSESQPKASSEANLALESSFELGRFVVQIQENQRLTPDEKSLLVAFANAIHSNQPETVDLSISELRKAAAFSPPKRYANEFLGDIAASKNELDKAIDHYSHEVETFSQDEANELIYPAGQATRLMLQEEQFERLRDTLRNPNFDRVLDPYTELSLATKVPDYPILIRSILQIDFDIEARWPLWILSACASLIWAIIIIQFAGFQKDRLCRFACAFLLGILSGSLTLFFVIWQDEIQGFSANETGTIVDQLIFFIAGVGLREELGKLLLFLPMIPFLLKRSDIDALICAGLVGLGFAFQENVGSGYLDYGIESALWARFLTANFIHLSLSGIIGLALVQACRWPRHRWDDALLTFLLAVTLHGVYDAAIMMPVFGEYGGILSLILMALIAWQFFKPLEEHMNSGRALQISPMGVFVIGSALLCGIVFCYACWGTPFVLALSGFIPGVAGLIPIAFLYINQFRDL